MNSSRKSHMSAASFATMSRHSDVQLLRSRMFIDNRHQMTASSFRSEMSRAGLGDLHCAPKGAQASSNTVVYKHCIPTGFSYRRGPNQRHFRRFAWTLLVLSALLLGSSVAAFAKEAQPN